MFFSQKNRYKKTLFLSVFSVNYDQQQWTARDLLAQRLRRFALSNVVYNRCYRTAIIFIIINIIFIWQEVILRIMNFL